MQLSSKDKKIAIVILAAGASTRMKAIKQLLPWKKTTLLGNAIEHGLASKVDTLFVVVGANKEKIIPTIIDYNIKIIDNDDWKLGLGKSIACSIDFLNNFPTQFDAVLIALADQPLLDASHYNKLIAEFSENDFGIVATQQNTTIGVPAIFSQKYIEHLIALNEDKGAKSVIKENLNDVCFIDTDYDALDVDTMGSYEKLYEKYGR